MGTGALLQGEGIKTSTSNHGHGGQYDQSLLAEAPISTKQMRQEGYNPAILKAPTPVNTTTLENRDLESGLSAGASKERLAAASGGAGGASPTPTPRPVPFFRTKKGVAVIIVAILVIIGVVIGGAVGGTRKHQKADGGVSDSGATVGNGGGGGSGSGIEGSPGKGAGGGGNNSSSTTVEVAPSSAASVNGSGNGNVQQGPTSTSGNPLGIGTTPTGVQQQSQATGITSSNGGAVQKPPVGIVGVGGSFADSIVKVAEAGLPL